MQRVSRADEVAPSSRRWLLVLSGLTLGVFPVLEYVILASVRDPASPLRKATLAPTAGLGLVLAGFLCWGLALGRGWVRGVGLAAAVYLGLGLLFVAYYVLRVGAADLADPRLVLLWPQWMLQMAFGFRG